MKKNVILSLIILLLAACSPSEAEIQAAINQTKTARPTLTPTVTNTPEPTVTPTPEPTETTDFLYFINLDYSQANDMFIETGIFCNERVIDDDGSYEQECFGSMDDGLIRGMISGHSEDTVSMLFFMVVPFIDSDITDFCKKTFPEFVDFGDSANEMQSWVLDNIGKAIKNEEFEMDKSFGDTRLILSNPSGVITLMVISSH